MKFQLFLTSLFPKLKLCHWWLGIFLWIALVAPAQASVIMRVAIRRGVEQVGLGSSTTALIKDASGRTLGQLPGRIEYFAKAVSGGIALDKWRSNLFWIEPTDKGFVYVVPMRQKSDVPKALKQFAKEIGAPDAIVCDSGGEQMSNQVKQFCNDIGTSLRALEEGTPWANKAELYIGLLKEAVRKDMREADSPLCLWDYCVERRARINNLTAKSRFNLESQCPYLDSG